MIMVGDQRYNVQIDGTNGDKCDKSIDRQKNAVYMCVNVICSCMEECRLWSSCSWGVCCFLKALCDKAASSRTHDDCILLLHFSLQDLPAILNTTFILFIHQLSNTMQVGCKLFEDGLFILINSQHLEKCLSCSRRQIYAEQKKTFMSSGDVYQFFFLQLIENI